MNGDNIDGMLAVLAGMVIFKASSYVPQLEDYMKKYPVVMVLLGFLLFFQRKKIVKFFKRDKK